MTFFSHITRKFGIWAAAATCTFVALVAPATPASANPEWTWPITPHRIIDRFRPPAHKWNAGHRGVDFAAHSGNKVVASNSGDVTFAGSIAHKGVVVISHGAFRTTYEPVQASVRVGEHVAAGSQIGILRPGKSHCSPRGVVTCLHLGALKSHNYIDPLSLLTGKVRLLPLGSQLMYSNALASDYDIAKHVDALVRKPRGVFQRKHVCRAVWLTNSHVQESPEQFVCRPRPRSNVSQQNAEGRAGLSRANLRYRPGPHEPLIAQLADQLACHEDQERLRHRCRHVPISVERSLSKTS